MIELYAITAAPAPSKHGLRAVENDGLAVLCSPAREAALSAEELWRREEMLDALMEECDLLPVRYGTVVDDEQAAARVLADRRAELMQALDRVRGAVEIAVRIAGDDSAAVDGALYMRVRRRLLEMHEALAELARESRELGPGRSAYLVPREEVAGFVASVGALEEANEDLSLLCTGPWPPYSFVTS